MIDEANNSVLAVPMLPGVSMEPIYRQHRSLSFSMGQDPTFFGYNDYSDDDDADTQTRYKNSLETMAEEDENGLLADDEMDFGPYRMRSKSSGAALSMLSSSQQGYLINRYMRRGSAEQQELVDDERRQWNGDASGSQGHMDSLDKDPVRRLAEQIEAMQLQQQQQQQQQAMMSYPMPPPPPPPADMYSHLHHPAAPPYYEHVEADPRLFQEGKGVGLHQLPPETLLYMIEFKAGRTDFFYIPPNDPNLQVHVGDLVIVEADRGKDLGKVAMERLTHDQILQLKKQQQHDSPQDDSSNPSSPKSQDDIKPSEIQIKRIYRQALADEVSVLLEKGEDESRALSVCQQKTKQRKLPMEVVDAEYQW
ncbi:hypothetical protein BJV82DRAFT_619723 [Fennellomyces sp. T-0311]|nr:hypothetical protein BJV82DRAFT_619723 [Fennellomyces sp. T-0311]